MKVKYNGDRFSYYYSAKPENLHKGGVYEVLKIIVEDSYTNYLIEDDAGNYGEFSSLWFDPVYEKTYIGFSRMQPVIGKPILVTIVTEVGKTTELNRTSKVQDVQPLGSNIYDVRTKNSRYIIRVANWGFKNSYLIVRVLLCRIKCLIF